MHGQFSPSDSRSQEYLANKYQNSRGLKAVPAFGLPLRFLVVLISLFTCRNAGLSAWQRIRIIERPLLILQIECLNRFLLWSCRVFIGFHTCTIPLVSLKASVLFSFHNHQRFGGRADRLYPVPPAPFWLGTSCGMLAYARRAQTLLLLCGLKQALYLLTYSDYPRIGGKE